MNTTLLRHAGFTMLEVLVSLLIAVVGLLGLLGLQTQAQVSEFESYQRAQALVLANDMVDRIAFNRGTDAAVTWRSDPPPGGRRRRAAPAR